MKRLNLFCLIAGTAVSVLAFPSCDPQAFSMNVEMRYPSASGIDISGKSAAVVYLEDDMQKDSVFNEYLANGFASSIESDYFGGRQSIGLYKMAKADGSDYSSADSLSRLVMETGSDIVFLFDAPEFGNVRVSEFNKSGGDGSDWYDVSAPVKIRLYAYDSMAGKDTVYVWEGSRNLTSKVHIDGTASASDVPSLFWPTLDEQGEMVGDLSSGIFKPVWKTEQYTFIYFDSPSEWETASRAAFEYKWKEAIEVWLKLVDTKNTMRRSCAEYDIAQACYMLGENELALKWLDRSDEDYPVSLSQGLRKRINARMK